MRGIYWNSYAGKGYHLKFQFQLFFFYLVGCLAGWLFVCLLLGFFFLFHLLLFCWGFCFCFFLQSYCARHYIYIGGKEDACPQAQNKRYQVGTKGWNKKKWWNKHASITGMKMFSGSEVIKVISILIHRLYSRLQWGKSQTFKTEGCKKLRSLKETHAVSSDSICHCFTWQ